MLVVNMNMSMSMMLVLLLIIRAVMQIQAHGAIWGMVQKLTVTGGSRREIQSAAHRAGFRVLTPRQAGVMPSIGRQAGGCNAGWLRWSLESYSKDPSWRQMSKLASC